MLQNVLLFILIYSVILLLYFFFLFKHVLAMQSTARVP